MGKPLAFRRQIVFFVSRRKCCILAKEFEVVLRMDGHQQRPRQSAAWPINPASSRNRSHRLLGGGAFTAIQQGAYGTHSQQPLGWHPDPASGDATTFRAYL